MTPDMIKLGKVVTAMNFQIAIAGDTLIRCMDGERNTLPQHYKPFNGGSFHKATPI